ncbi:hypothetical protein [Luteitalea sp.]|jgi:hypothetical protein|uniref:hypothetical protein n=1 Tax=Luteitalea sp. TaxID=2004800 RepID=UPI0025BB1C05|nr:hypothetical protein [Luteitalea sp.]
MIANAAFLAALVLFLFVAWLAGELTFLAPYKSTLFHRHAEVLGGGILLLFLNLCALFYGISRWLFLRDAGRKLTHVDRQLGTPDSVHEDLKPYLTRR